MEATTAEEDKKTENVDISKILAKGKAAQDKMARTLEAKTVEDKKRGRVGGR